MAKQRSPNRDEALKIYIKHQGKVTNRKIAEMLGEKEKTISNWKSRDKWNVVLQNGECSTTNKKTSNAGAPKGNKNAKGNRGGAAPKGNKNAIKHGLYETIVVENLSEEDQRLFYLSGEISGLDQELQIARYKVARLIKEQRLQTLKGTAIAGDGTAFPYPLRDDFYEEAITKGLELVARLEDRINKLRLEEEKLKIAQEKLALDKLRIAGEEEEYEDDGFIEALEGKIKEVWDDESEET